MCVWVCVCARWFNKFFLWVWLHFFSTLSNVINPDPKKILKRRKIKNYRPLQKDGIVFSFLFLGEISHFGRLLKIISFFNIFPLTWWIGRGCYDNIYAVTNNMCTWVGGVWVERLSFPTHLRGDDSERLEWDFTRTSATNISVDFEFRKMHRSFLSLSFTLIQFLSFFISFLFQLLLSFVFSS